MHVFHCAILACMLVARCAFAVDPIVDLTYGKYAGVSLSNGITQWLGLSYAASPIGNRRFVRPQDPVPFSGTKQANKPGAICISTPLNSNCSAGIDAGQSEDCLNLAVYAPSAATANSNLPVFFFIQGGGFNSDANPNLNGTGLIKASGGKIVVVTINYRVGPFGFLASFASSPNGQSANNGLLDQYKALQWVQQHISKFGGNPDQVVLGGDSAGAGSIALLLTAYGGRNDNLFHGAAAESVSFGQVLTNSEASPIYDHLAKGVNCPSSTQSGSLACLQNSSLSADKIHTASCNIALSGRSTPPLYQWDPTIDADFIQSLTHDAFAQGKFIKDIPTLIGDATDDGLIFTPSSVASQSDMDNFLLDQFPALTPDQIDQINTKFGRNCTTADCWRREAAAAYGEMRYVCPGLLISRTYASLSVPASSAKSKTTHKRRSKKSDTVAKAIKTVAPSNKAWFWRWDVHDSTEDGVPHTVEIHAIFGPNYSGAGTPPSYFPGGSNAEAVPLIQHYWTSFIQSLDPNPSRDRGSAQWNQYFDSSGKPQRMLFQTGGTSKMVLIDSDQLSRCSYLQGIESAIKQ